MSESEEDLIFLYQRVTRVLSEKEKSQVFDLRKSMQDEIGSFSRDLEQKLITPQQYLDLFAKNSISYMTKIKQILGNDTYFQMFDTNEVDLSYVIDRDIFLSQFEKAA